MIILTQEQVGELKDFRRFDIVCLKAGEKILTLEVIGVDEVGFEYKGKPIASKKDGTLEVEEFEGEGE